MFLQHILDIRFSSPAGCPPLNLENVLLPATVLVTSIQALSLNFGFWVVSLSNDRFYLNVERFREFTKPGWCPPPSSHSNHVTHPGCQSQDASSFGVYAAGPWPSEMKSAITATQRVFADSLSSIFGSVATYEVKFCTRT